MVTHFRVALFICFSSLLAMTACQAPQTETENPESVAAVPGDVDNQQSEETTSEAVPDAWEIEFSRQRLIGDLLYDALKALQQDRLLTPIDDNAYSRYQRVLAYDPENRLALEGLQNIMNRYLALAEEAGRQGRFPVAQSLLERARFVDEDNPAIVQAQQWLDSEMNSGDLVFELPLPSLTARSAEVTQQLADVAATAQEQDAFLMITAPTDELARWMYSTMREAVPGYRLRGNIELGAHAIIRLRMNRQTTGGGNGANSDDETSSDTADTH